MTATSRDNHIDNGTARDASSMRALRFHRLGGPEVLVIDTVGRPEVGPGKVLVRVAAAGLNAADVLERTGRYLDQRSLPATIGREVAGTIEVIGEGVSGLVPGQRVMGFARGSLADSVVTIPSLLFPIPNDLSFVDAAALPLQGLTAYLMLASVGRLQGGESVLVQSAAGGVGLLAIQLARLLGARTVVGTASTETKRHLIRTLGVDAAIDYTDAGVVDRVRQITGGQGADVMLDATGGDHMRRSLDALSPRGRLIVYGRTSGNAGSLDAYDLVPRSLSVHGFALQTYLRQTDLTTRAMTELTRSIKRGTLKLTLGGIYPLERFADAFAALEDREVVGKIVVTVNEKEHAELRHATS